MSGLETGSVRIAELRRRIEAVADLYETRLAAARTAGISPDQLQAYITGRSRPSFIPLARLAEGCNVRLDWLWHGTGPMRVGADVAEAGGAYADAGALVPVRRLPDAGGTAPERVALERAWIVNGLGCAPEALVLVEVRDDAMAPTLEAGDVLLVDTARAASREDGIYVVRGAGGPMPKRLQFGFDGTVRVLSDNPAYRPQALAPEVLERLDIVGRVVLVARRV